MPLGVIFAITMFWALKVERIKKENDIQTYKEIVAFCEREKLDEIHKMVETGKHPYQNILKVVLSALVTAADYFDRYYRRQDDPYLEPESMRNDYCRTIIYPDMYRDYAYTEITLKFFFEKFSMIFLIILAKPTECIPNQIVSESQKAKRYPVILYGTAKG